MAHGCILIVDDDAEVRSALTDLLHEDGYIVMTATTGQEALAVIETVHFDVLLVDLTTSLFDGENLAQTLQARGVRTPLVTMTGAQRGATLANKVDAALSLEKTYDVGVLLATIDRVVQETRNTSVPIPVVDDDKSIPTAPAALLQEEGYSVRIPAKADRPKPVDLNLLLWTIHRIIRETYGDPLH